MEGAGWKGDKRRNLSVQLTKEFSETEVTAKSMMEAHGRGGGGREKETALCLFTTSSTFQQILCKYFLVVSLLEPQNR